jgi:hypothetical protein
METYIYADEAYTSIRVQNGGTVMFVPVDPANGDYARLLADGVEIADYVASPAPPRIFSKRRFFLALTDAEYDTFASIEAQQPARDRRAFAEATELNEGDADWPQFLGLMHATYGEERTAEILGAAAI